MHLSVIYGVPCHVVVNMLSGHRNRLSRNFFDLSFPGTWLRCVLDIQKLEREVPDESPAHITCLKELAIRNIKRFSHSKGKSAIQKYVDHNFKVDVGFALGLPISVLNLISEAIRSFSK
jgi:hypothetical protein